MITLKNAARLLTVTSLVTLATMSGGITAHATGVGIASFETCTKAASDTASDSRPRRCVSGFMTARVVSGTGTVRYVQFECFASGAFDPASMTMDVCSLGGISAIDVPHTAPGAVITQTGVAVVNAGVPLSACIGATGRWLLEPLPVSGGTCRTVILDLLP